LFVAVGRFHLTHGFLGLSRNIRERTDYEVFPVRVAFVEAPPHAPGKIRHFFRRDVVEPFPGERAFPHAADGHKVEDARVSWHLLVCRDPIGKEIQLHLAPDYVFSLKQRVRVGNVRLGKFRDDIGRMKIGNLYLLIRRCMFLLEFTKRMNDQTA
jgi:hypothetical protein